MAKRIDRLFFWFIIGFSIFGFLIFLSASLGLLNRDGARFNVVALKQFILLSIGLGLFLIVGRLNYRSWQKMALIIGLASLLLTCLVFIPNLGFEAGGAKRWIALGGLTVQPAEFMKLGFIFCFAAWLGEPSNKKHLSTAGLWTFLILLSLTALPLVLQPDIDTLFIIFSAGLAMFLVSEARWSHIGLIIVLVAIAASLIAWQKPYIVERIKTYLDPTRDPLSASWQVNQSLIAIGSGGTSGRGFGQSLQKFHYLPEPIGDSIFAVAAEEFGFIGGILIIVSFVIFALLGLKVSIRAPTNFGRLLCVGIVIMITTGAFINIASMLGLIPLTGTPLLFISHGGTALLVAFIGSGVILSVARSTVKHYPS